MLKFHEKGWEVFKTDYEYFFREQFPELFVNATFKKIGRTQVKLYKIDKVSLVKIVPPTTLQYDLAFYVTIAYKHYYEYDLDTDAWIERAPKNGVNLVTSQELRGIFRTEINYPWRALKDRLRSNKINFVCLSKHSDLSEQEFTETMRNSNIYTYFVK